MSEVDIVDGERVFQLMDTHGMPFDMICEELIEKDCAIDLRDFIRAALNHGWKTKTIASKISEVMELGLGNAFGEWNVRTQ